MSRLDSAIRRLLAQRACLDAAARRIDDIAGPVLELGLGNGRSYDHLRQILPGREIFVFDRRIAAHPDCIPDPAHMVLGDFRDTVGVAAERIGAPAALAHLDIGSGDRTATAELADWLSGLIPGLLADGAMIVADQPLEAETLRHEPLPDDVAPGRYYMYRHRRPS